MKIFSQMRISSFHCSFSRISSRNGYRTSILGFKHYKRPYKHGCINQKVLLYDLQNIRQQSILKFNLNFHTGISDMKVSALLQSINWQFKTSKRLAQWTMKTTNQIYSGICLFYTSLEWLYSSAIMGNESLTIWWKY